MGLSKYKFGELLELTNEQNIHGKYGEDDAIGVNVDKIIQPMRGKISEKDFSKFHLVPPRHFAYNPRGSRKLGIGFNDTDKTFIITFNDNVFRIKDDARATLLDTYLFIFLSRKEWDRYAEFISWGSSTEVFDWTNFCDEEILLPPLDIQQKYVDIYNALVANQQSYERGLEDLKLVCDGYVENAKRINEVENGRKFFLGDLIEQRREKYDGSKIPIRGVSKEGFIEPKQPDADLRLYNQYYYNDFVFNPARMELNSIALNSYFEKACCSSLYEVFYVKRPDMILPEYLNLLLKHSYRT